VAGSLGYAVERALKRFEFRYIQPLQVAARKRRRLALFGFDRLGDVPWAEVDWKCATPQCVPGCAAWIAGERRYFAKYLAPDGPRVRSGSALWRGVPCVIDLGRYPDFATYADRLRRHSKGGVLRQVRRAREQGFACRMIFRDFYLRQLFEIEVSKRFRSGLVLSTVLRQPPASDFADGITPDRIAEYLGRPVTEIASGIRLPEPPPPACAHHWDTDWAVFANEAGADGSGQGAAGERLVGYLFLRRTGDIVRTTGLMGHGAYLSQNVMKLLFHDVIAWLLRREDPRVQGLRYFHYGAIEHGSAGLAAWKRSFEFAPMQYRWPAEALSTGQI
jgi:hypothetical protein